MSNNNTTAIVTAVLSVETFTGIETLCKKFFSTQAAKNWIAKMSSPEILIGGKVVHTLIA